MKISKIRRGANNKYQYSSNLIELREIISNHRINFLIGSGFSYSLLESQGNIEEILKLNKVTERNYSKIKSYLLWNYFLKSIHPLLKLNLDVTPQKEFTLNMKSILSNTEISLLTKQINIFTTNFDPLLELGFNRKDEIYYNDGLYGKTVPIFSIDNYKEIVSDPTIYRNDVEELQPTLEMPDIRVRPTLNIFKLHGSLTWKRNIYNNNIEYVDFHTVIYEFYRKYKDIFDTTIVDKLNSLLNNSGLNDNKIKKYLDKIFFREADTKKLDKKEDIFYEDFFNSFVIVDPFRKKFTLEILELYYFRLLKVFAEEIGKAKAALFVFGTSFNDPHIKQLILNELKNNSLTMYIFCYDEYEAELFESYFHDNSDKVTIICPVNSTYSINDFNDLLSLINKGTSE